MSAHAVTSATGTQVGADDFYLFSVRDSGSASPLFGLRVVEVAGIGTEPVLIDPASIGTLYTDTLTAMADPYSEFKKNLTTIRLEMTALMHVRNPSGAYVVGAS